MYVKQAKKNPPDEPAGPVYLCACLLLLRRKHHDSLATFHFREGLHYGQLFQIVFDTIQNVQAEVLMCHFTTAETQCDFGLVALFQKANQVAQFYLIVAFISSRTEFDFLNLDLFLLLFLLFLGLALLVEELTVIHHPAYRGFSVRTDFYQIHTCFDGRVQSFFDSYYTNGFAVRSNQTNLFATDFTIDAGAGRLLARFLSAVDSLFLHSLLSTSPDLFL